VTDEQPATAKIAKTDQAEQSPSTVVPSAAEACSVSTTSQLEDAALQIAIKSDLASLAVPLRQLKRFELIRPLGAGGMGAVFEVFDHDRKAKVALKTIRRPHPGAIFRFKHEFLRLANLAHPNLVPLYELISEAGHWFFTMKLVEGTNILKYLRESNAECLRPVLSQVAKGVHALHVAGILHRDLKPSNVMVTPDGQVVVLDFGLTTTIESGSLFESQDHSPVGTTQYSSPEQMDALDLTPASDWYSFGVMLFELLTGSLPYTGDRRRLREAKANAAPVPKAVSPHVPDDLNDLCVALLDPHAGARPRGDEILAVLERGLSAGQPSAPQLKSAHERVFVGRELLLTELCDAFLVCCNGLPAAIHLVGKSGAGKTALAEHFLQGLRRENAVVLAGRCYERVSVAYPGLDGLVDSLTRFLRKLSTSNQAAVLPRDVAALAQVFPVLASVAAVADSPRAKIDLIDQQDLKRRAMRALRELLGRLGDRRPLVLYVDDFQWADPDSAAVLTDLLTPPDPPALLLLLAYRSEGADTNPAIAVLRQRAHTELLVNELTNHESETLALALLRRSGQPPAFASYARKIARESAGNPYLITELTHTLTAGDANPMPAPSGDVTVDTMVWTRAQQLPAAAFRLLQVVALAGQPLETGIVCHAARVDDVMQETVNLLQSQHFIRTAPTERGITLEAFHDQVRESICAHLVPAAANEYHQGLAEALESHGFPDAAVIAAHYLAAGAHARSAVHFEQAAEQAAQALAFERAAGFYRLAIEHGKPRDQHRVRMRTALADALANAGRGPEAAAEYLIAADDEHATDSTELRRRAMLQFLISGHMDEGLDILRQVALEFGMKLPATPRKMILSLLRCKMSSWLRGGRLHRNVDVIEARQRADFCWSAVIGNLFVCPMRSVWFQVHHLKYARGSQDDRRLARSLLAEAILNSFGGTRAQWHSNRLLDRARRLADETNDAYLHGLSSFAEASRVHNLCRFKDAISHFDRSRSILQSADWSHGIIWERDMATVFTDWSLMFIGELVELGRRLSQQNDEWKDRGNLLLASSAVLVNTMLMLAADDPQGAREHVQKVMRQWTQHEFQWQHVLALIAEMHIDLYLGDGRSSWKRLDEHWNAISSAQLLRVEVLRLFLHYLRACSVLACRPSSQSMLQEASGDAKRLAREHADCCKPMAAAVRACVAHRNGDLFSAGRLFLQAAAHLDASDLALYAAAARRRAGESIGGHEGAALIREAEDWMRSQGIRNPARMTAMFAPV